MRLFGRGKVSGDLRSDQPDYACAEERDENPDFSACIRYVEPENSDHADQGGRKASDDKRFHHARDVSRRPLGKTGRPFVQRTPDLRLNARAEGVEEGGERFPLR